MIRFLIVVVGIVAGLFGVVWLAQSPVLLKVLDRSSPEIQLVREPAAFGASAVSFTVQTFDRGVGTGSLLASLKQGSKTATCTVTPQRTETLADGVIADTFEVTCDAVMGALVEGPASLDLSAQDLSTWNNQSQRSHTTEVDFTAPQIEVLTLQHAVQQGGSELVFFRVDDRKIVAAGVRIGALYFPAVPARGIDPSFPEQTAAFAAVFALPRTWNNQELVKVVAEDEAQNIAELPLRFKVQERASPKAPITISESFLNEKVEPLIPKYDLFMRRYFPERAEKLLKEIPDASDREGRFRTVNESFRGLLDERLTDLLSKTSKERLWQGEFIKPMPSAVSSNFGEERSFSFEGKPFGGSIHNGFDLASTERDIVRSTNEGIVVMAEDFGLYGNAILIDHGLGVFSLYGHLSVLQVKPGDRVLKGDIIARSGQTGFAGGDHLHFEIRVGSVPVTPIEWWDPHWYQDNILGKIEAAKVRL